MKTDRHDGKADWASICSTPRVGSLTAWVFGWRLISLTIYLCTFMILPQLNHHNRPYGILLKPEEQVPQNGRLYSSNNNLQLLVLLQSLALSPEWTARKAASTGVSKYSPSRMRTVQTYVNGNAITACIWNVRNLGRSNSLSTDCHGGSSSHLTSKSTSLSPPHRSSSTFQYEFRNSFIFYPLRQARFDVQCYRNASAI